MFERLIQRVMPPNADQPTRAIIERAVHTAVEVTHECGTEEDTEEAIFEFYCEAIGKAYNHLLKGGGHD